LNSKTINEKADGRKEEEKGRDIRTNYYYCHYCVSLDVPLRPFFGPRLQKQQVSILQRVDLVYE